MNYNKYSLKNNKAPVLTTSYQSPYTSSSTNNNNTPTTTTSSYQSPYTSIRTNNNNTPATTTSYQSPYTSIGTNNNNKNKNKTPVLTTSYQSPYTSSSTNNKAPVTTTSYQSPYNSIGINNNNNKNKAPLTTTSYQSPYTSIGTNNNNNKAPVTTSYQSPYSTISGNNNPGYTSSYQSLLNKNNKPKKTNSGLNENVNSNNFLLGVSPKYEGSTGQSYYSQPSLINHINQIRNTIINENQNNNPKKKINNLNIPNSMRNIVNKLITKLEDDVMTLQNQVSNYNKNKEEIQKISGKEINKLKNIIKKMSILILTIYKSFDLGQKNRVELLEKLRKTIETNPIFLNDVDKILHANNGSNENNTNQENNVSIYNIMNKKVTIPPANKSGNNKTGDNKLSPAFLNLLQENLSINEKNGNNNFYENLEKKKERNSRYKMIVSKINSTKINEQKARNNLNRYF